MFLVAAVAESGDSTLTSGLADDDCACAMFRHIAAEPPSSVMNSRRFIVLNRGVVPTPHCASNRKDSTAETAALRDSMQPMSAWVRTRYYRTPASSAASPSAADITFISPG